jgi:CsoR family transcriptional regulator, copper-sensing transcriptional repressor
MDLHREFFEELAGDWNSQQPVDRIVHLDMLVKNVVPGLTRCNKILNIGSGTGVLPGILTRNYPGVTVVSIDFAFAMVHSHHNAECEAQLIQADVHALPTNRNVFDAVICHNSFPHFKDHPAAIKEMMRVLKEGSLLVILHDISRQKVNQVHGCAHANVIHHDLLPEPERLSGLLKTCGLRETSASEGEDYFIAFGKKF